MVYHQQVILCCIVLFFSAILCSAAGIGGGGIYVAVLMVCGGLTPHDAVPLSKAVVFFGSVSSLVVNLVVQARSYSTTPGGKTVIDTDACRLVVPATLIGTFLGVLLNRHTSDYIIVMTLTCLLGLMTGMVLRTAQMQALEESINDHASLPASSSADQTFQARGPNAVSSIGEQPSSQEADVSTPLLQEKKEVVATGDPCRSITPTLPLARKDMLSSKDAGMGGALLFLVILGGILRFHMQACRAEILGDASKVGACIHPVNALFGSHMHTWMSSAVTSSLLQQFAAGLPLWACIGITVHFGFVAKRDVGWQARSIALYQVVSVMTGLLAGLVGVGGGLILSPFFLLTGMEPAVAVGTSATCVLFTSSSTTLQYMFTDRVIMSLALVYGLVTLVASFAGTCLVHIIQEKFARKSYISMIVALGVAISALLSVIKFVYLIITPQAVKPDGQTLEKLAPFF